MTAEGGGVVEAQARRLAAPLWRLAGRVLGDLAPGDAPESLAAVRAFTEAPSPARYLAATRVLRAAERRHKLGALGRVLGDRRKEHGLDTLARTAGLSLELLDALRALPAHPRNGRRLAIISDLLVAHRLIEARAAGALRALQQSLGPVSPPRAVVERRQKRRAGAAR
jgi:hypothetical protein